MVNWIYFALIAAIGFGVQAILFRFAMDKGVSSTLVTAIIFSLASVVIWSYAAATEKIILPTKNYIILALVVASIISAFANIAGFKSISTVPNPGYAVAVYSTSILITTVLSLFVFNLKVNLMGLVGVAFIFIGIVLLSGIIKV